MADEDGVMPREFPLTETDLDDINRALVRLKGAEDLMSKSQQAGIDVTPFRDRSRETQDRLLKIKQAFFPGR